MQLAERKPTRRLAWAIAISILMFAAASLISAIAPNGLI